MTYTNQQNYTNEQSFPAEERDPVAHPTYPPRPPRATRPIYSFVDSFVDTNDADAAPSKTGDTSDGASKAAYSR